jgi:hypothetical protein
MNESMQAVAGLEFEICAALMLSLSGTMHACSAFSAKVGRVFYCQPAGPSLTCCCSWEIIHEEN